MRIPSGLIMFIVLILVIFGISLLFYKTNKKVNFESKKEITYTNLSVDKSRAILWEILEDNPLESLSFLEEEEPSDAQASTPEPSTGNQSLKAIQSLLRGNLPQRKD
jgi:hypothetical protein